MNDIDRLEKNGVGGFTTIEEQKALIALARQAFVAQPSHPADGLRPERAGDPNDPPAADA